MTACVRQFTEYGVRELDAYGDALDVSHYDTKKQAIEAAERVVGV